MLILSSTWSKTFSSTRKRLAGTVCSRSPWHITVHFSNHFLSCGTFSVGSTPWPTFNMVLIIWNVLIFDWITLRLAGSALSSAALGVPLHILSSFINNHSAQDEQAGLGLNNLAALIDWKKLNLHLNLFINLPPVLVARRWHAYVITLAPLLPGITDVVKKIFHVPSLYHSRRGKWMPRSINEDGVITAMLLFLSHLFTFIPGPTASIFPYVNVTMLPYRPQNIHLLVEMSQHQHHCASIHCSGTPKKGSRGTVLFSLEAFLCCNA